MHLLSFTLAFQMSELETKQAAMLIGSSEPTLILNPQPDKAKALAKGLLHHPDTAEAGM